MDWHCIALSEALPQPRPPSHLVAVVVMAVVVVRQIVKLPIRQTKAILLHGFVPGRIEKIPGWSGVVLLSASASPGQPLSP
jgi:hypothetical protein